MRQTKLIPAAEMQRVRRFARFWDLIGNSGNFVTTTPLIWSNGEPPFRAFLRLVDWLHAQLGRQHGIPLVELAESLFRFLTQEKGLPQANVAATLWADYSAAGRSDKPVFLRPHLPDTAVSRRDRARGVVPKRQQRHLAAGTVAGKQ